MKVGQPRRDHVGHLGAVAVPVGDGDVEAVIDGGFGSRSGEPVVVGVAEGLGAIGDGEVDDGSHSSARRGAGAGTPVVGGNGPAEGEFEVDMNIQTAGDQDLA